MSEVVTWKITGLDELQDRLAELPKTIASRVLRKTLRDAGESLKSAIVAAAPHHTGFLSEHFDVRVSVKANELEATAFIGPEGRMYYPGVGEKERGVSTGKFPHKGGLVPVASVARFLEFGTRKMGAKPFMSTTFEEKKEGLINEIIDGIREALDKYLV